MYYKRLLLKPEYNQKLFFFLSFETFWDKTLTDLQWGVPGRGGGWWGTAGFLLRASHGRGYLYRWWKYTFCRSHHSADHLLSKLGLTSFHVLQRQELSHCVWLQCSSAPISDVVSWLEIWRLHSKIVGGRREVGAAAESGPAESRS